MIVTALLVVGLGTGTILNTLRTGTNLARIEFNENIENQMNERIQQSLRTLQKSVEKTRDLATKTADTVDRLEQNLPNAMIYVSDLSYSFRKTKEDLTDIQLDWDKGKINRKLANLFNLTLPCSPNCPYDIPYLTLVLSINKFKSFRRTFKYLKLPKMSMLSMLTILI